MPDRYLCRKCSKVITATKNRRYRTHTNKDGDPCGNSSDVIPADLSPENDKKDDDTPKRGNDFEVCPDCDRSVKITNMGYFEPHNKTLYGGDRCPLGGVRVSNVRKVEDVTLPGDDLPARGATMATFPKKTNQQEVEEATSTAPTSENVGVDSSPKELLPSGGAVEPDDPAGEPTAYVDLIKEELGGDLTFTFLQPGPAPDAEPGASTETNSPESETTSSTSPESPSGTGRDATVFSLGTVVSDRFLQPSSPFLQPVAIVEPAPDTEETSAPPIFLQPPEYEGPAKGEPMGDLAKELATKIKETFYSYSNRNTADNRSAQTTLGPSEIGTPCDRRLAMTLLNIPAVNPGGDGWAAFVGTCTHVGMAEVYTFADAGTGRYAVELPVFTGSSVVPRGTLDNLDRRDSTVIDWKIMGAYSLKQFKLNGPKPAYRTQAHVYGLGAERAGEKVKNVAVVGLPRAGSSLDELHVWTEKYDRKFAQAALDRVEAIAGRAGFMTGNAMETPMDAARKFDTEDDCRFCPFFLKGDTEMARGCPGAGKGSK